MVVSDLDEAELRPKLAALEAWQGPGRRAGRFLAQSGPYSGLRLSLRVQARVRRPAVRYQLDATWLDDQVLSAGYDYYRETHALDDRQRVENTRTSCSSN